jgi:hypothetical protein
MARKLRADNVGDRNTRAFVVVKQNGMECIEPEGGKLAAPGEFLPTSDRAQRPEPRSSHECVPTRLLIPSSCCGIVIASDSAAAYCLIVLAPVERAQTSAYPVPMARRPATTKATGGGGYTFADNALLDSLCTCFRAPHLSTKHSARPSKSISKPAIPGTCSTTCWWLCLGTGDSATRGAVSIKSGRELTAAGFSDEFVQDAWDEWQRPGFDINADLLVLVVGVVGMEF